MEGCPRKPTSPRPSGSCSSWWACSGSSRTRSSAPPGAADDAQQRAGAAEDGAIFGTNALHDVVHLASGLVALWAGFLSGTPERHSKLYNVGFGLVYALVTLVGFAAPGTMRDLLAVNTADNVLHLAITIVLLGVGFGLDVEESPSPA